MYRELRGDDRKNSVLRVPLNSFMVPSYDQKTKNMFTSIEVTSNPMNTQKDRKGGETY